MRNSLAELRETLAQALSHSGLGDSLGQMCFQGKEVCCLCVVFCPDVHGLHSDMEGHSALEIPSNVEISF